MTRSRDVADTQDNLGGAVAPYVGAKNAVINGGMDIWARGTSFTNGNGTNIYGADRWHIYSPASTGRTWSRQVTGDSTNLPFIQYSQRLQRNSGDSQTNVIYITSDFESVNSIPFAGKTVTLSFYARAGANFSSSSNIVNATVVTGTGTDQNSLLGFTNFGTPVQGNAIVTTTWQRFSFTGTLAATTTQIGLQIGYAPTGTAGTNDWFEITGVQLELGAQMTPFARAGGSIGGELALCQRYYYRTTSSSMAWGTNYTTTVCRAAVYFPVEMRIAPTALEQTGTAGDYSIGQAGGGGGVLTAVPSFSGTSTRYATVNGVVASGLTQFYPSYIQQTASTGYLGWSAEL
jgi:hypothetical protein